MINSGESDTRRGGLPLRLLLEVDHRPGGHARDGRGDDPPDRRHRRVPDRRHSEREDRDELLSIDCRRPAPTGRSSTPRRLGYIADVSGILDHPLSRVTTAGVVPAGLSPVRSSKVASTTCSNEAILRRQKFSSGPDVSVIGQGTWYIDRGDRRRAVAALRRGLDLGMGHIDTAEMYGDAEPVVAEAIAGRRDEVFLVSKVLPSNASRRGTITACERSLARLKTDRLDCLAVELVEPRAQALGAPRRRLLAHHLAAARDRAERHGRAVVRGHHPQRRRRHEDVAHAEPRDQVERRAPGRTSSSGTQAPAGRGRGRA